MRTTCYGPYWALCRRVAPGLVDAQHRYVAALEEAVRPGTRWLDLGCGRRAVPAWLPDAAAREAALVARAGLVVGVDLDADSLAGNRVHPCVAMADLTALPFAAASFDLVTANMVVEHLQDPRAVLREVARVAAPGARVLFHTPNRLHPLTRLASRAPRWATRAGARVLEGRRSADVFPTYYAMNTEADVAAAAADAGLRVERIDLVESSATTAALGPLSVGELALVRLSRRERFRPLRSNLIATLRAA